MRAFTRGQCRAAAVAGLLLLGAAGVSRAESSDDSSVYARTVQSSLATLDKAKTIQFEMTITQFIASGATSMPEVRRYRVSVSRPDRLAVVPLTPETAQFGMASDGEELLCYTPFSRQYCVVEAPETLRGMYAAVFKPSVRDFELYVTLAPFIQDPKRWQERDPSFVSDGEPLSETEYGGVPCAVFLGSRAAKFFETDKRGLYRGRQTFSGDFRQSEPGQWVPRSLTAVTIDKWTLDGDISGSEFSVKPPAGYARVKDPTALPPEPDDSVRTTPARPVVDLPANASSAQVRQRARALFTTGYDSSPVTGQLFQRAADLGDPLAVMWVARLQQRGMAGFPADAAAAQTRAQTVVAKVKDLAEKGDLDAQFLWGMACVTGLATLANPQEGLRWLRQAAEKGDTLAMNNVGALLIDSVRGPGDEGTGFRLVEKAARLGNGSAFGNLASFYHWGVGVEPDRGKALVWYVKATALGHSQADNVGLLRRCEKTHPFTADAIRAVPYVKLFGTHVEDLSKVAVAAGVVPADAVLLLPAPGERWLPYSYKKHGILFGPRFGRIRTAELFAQGVKGFAQFTGQLPLGLAWDDTGESVLKKLGQPDDQGDVAGDAAYGMAYIIDNLSFAVMFNYEAPGHVKLVRIMERWGQPQAKTPPAPVPAAK